MVSSMASATFYSSVTKSSKLSRTIFFLAPSLVVKGNYRNFLTYNDALSQELPNGMAHPQQEYAGNEGDRRCLRSERKVQVDDAYLGGELIGGKTCI